MAYNQEFIKSVMDKLDRLNSQQGIQPGDFDANRRGHNTKIDGLAPLNFLDVMGSAALRYIESKKSSTPIPPDPLFPDRN